MLRRLIVSAVVVGPGCGSAGDDDGDTSVDAATRDASSGTDGDAGDGDGDGDGDGSSGDGDGGDGDGTAAVSDPLEAAADDVYAGGLGPDNWVADPDISPNAGATAFLTSNGGAVDFPGLQLHKMLGGAIADVPYTVTLFVSLGEAGAESLELADFTELRIGGPTPATVAWSTTPVPDTEGAWVQWSGTFTPDAADVGQPFELFAEFTLPGGHAFALDGLVEAAAN